MRKRSVLFTLMIVLSSYLVSADVMSTINDVFRKIISIGNLSFLGISDGNLVTGFTRILIWILTFTVLFAVADSLSGRGPLGFLRKNHLMVVTGIVATITAIFIPSAVLLGIGATYATFVALALIGLPVVGMAYLLWQIPGKGEEEKCHHVFIKMIISLILMWILTVMAHHVKGLSNGVSPAVRNSVDQFVGWFIILSILMFIYYLIKLLFCKSRRRRRVEDPWRNLRDLADRFNLPSRDEETPRREDNGREPERESPEDGEDEQPAGDVIPPGTFDEGSGRDGSSGAEETHRILRQILVRLDRIESNITSVLGRIESVLGSLSAELKLTRAEIAQVKILLNEAIDNLRIEIKKIIKEHFDQVITTINENNQFVMTAINDVRNEIRITSSETNGRIDVLISQVEKINLNISQLEIKLEENKNSIESTLQQILVQMQEIKNVTVKNETVNNINIEITEIKQKIVSIEEHKRVIIALKNQIDFLIQQQQKLILNLSIILNGGGPGGDPVKTAKQIAEEIRSRIITTNKTLGWLRKKNKALYESIGLFDRKESIKIQRLLTKNTRDDDEKALLRSLIDKLEKWVNKIIAARIFDIIQFKGEGVEETRKISLEMLEKDVKILKEMVDRGDI